MRMNDTDRLERLVDEVEATAARPLAAAIALPPEAYTDDAFHAVERERVFRAGWICIAHVSEVPEPGRYLALDLLDEPLMVVRGKDGQVRVLSRVCPHRSMDIMPEAGKFPREGSARLFSCPYHAWTYELDGTLRGCPHMQHAADFDRADWPLPLLRSETWNGFVFVNLDGRAAPVAEHYADLDALLRPWRIAEMGIAITMDWECDFNWKVMIENWMESYHHIGAHRDTLNRLMPGENTWTEPEHPHFIRAHLPYTDALKAEVRRTSEAGGAMPGFRPIPGLSEEQQTEWGLFVGHPFFMFLTMPDRLLWYRLFPLSAGKCRLQTMTLVSRETLDDPDLPAMIEAETPLLRDFHLEDMVVNTGVQKGLASRHAGRGRLSHLEEPIWLIQRHLAARLRGRLPEKAARRPYYGPRAAAE
jgi:phenylpropionate dioxygenase-like ring-hydroxylating dioxygenase large terminal subunit